MGRSCADWMKRRIAGRSSEGAPSAPTGIDIPTLRCRCGAAGPGSQGAPKRIAGLQPQRFLEWPAADLQRQWQAGFAEAVADRQSRAAGDVEGAIEERLEAGCHRVLADRTGRAAG